MRILKSLLAGLVFVFAFGLAASANDGPIGCDPPYLISTLADPHGTVRVRNPEQNPMITTVVFRNRGAGDVSISHVKFVANGRPIIGTPGDMGATVGPGSEISLLFSNNNPLQVSRIQFDVTGATNLLEVYGLNCSGPIPGGFSGGNK
jgi:hypothetical protein